MSRFVWTLDEYVNHRLPRWAFQGWLCDLNETLLRDGGVWIVSNILRRHH